MEIYKQYLNTNYEVSDHGNVRTIPHISIRSNGRTHSVQQRILKSATDNKGYLRVGLSIEGKLCTHKVHRLVAELFIPNPSNLPQVNHKWGDKKDNRATELEWCTNKQNVQHAYDTGLIKNIYLPVENKENFKRGPDNHAAKMTSFIVLEARQLRASGHSYQKIADIYGVNKKTIINAIKGITWNQI